MPARQGRCINFGRCLKADSSEVVEVHAGDPFICPYHSCGEPLEELEPAKSSFPRPLHIIAILAIAALLAAAFFYPWRSAAPVAHANDTPATIVPQAKASDPSPCQKKDWTKAKERDFLLTNCVGVGVVAYDDRLEYVYSLKQVKNWANVKPSDPRLLDCAGLRACEERAQDIETPAVSRPLPREKPEARPKQSKWASASCETIIGSWESEDYRLSTATCGGLGEAECSHIKRCLGLHPLDVGPGSSKFEP